MAESEQDLTVTEAARAAGVSRDTIHGWITDGLLSATLVEGRWRIRLADLRASEASIYLGGVIPAWRADPARAGTRLRTLREASGWTQQQLAARSGLTHEAISNLERGQRAPYAATARALADALDIAPERFVDAEPLGLSTLTVAEAAARLGIPAGRLRKWLRQGELAGSKVSGEWRVLAVAVHEFGRSGRLRGHSRRLDPRYRG